MTKRVHCVNCKSEKIEFIDNVNLGTGQGKLYVCNACGIEFVLDGDGLLVREA